MKERTKRRNLNRGYMKLEVWNDAIELSEVTYNPVDKISYLDYKLNTQIIDTAQLTNKKINVEKFLTHFLQCLTIPLEKIRFIKGI
ncbi:MAG: hypothetical protein PHY57_01650 [Ignavibacterium sp.]|jgi:hypothetical protein|nr:hypothetical protein [Ignavibacterium sp.]MDX9711943.1 hypothetical protein [Ignavibacteriaceae bacterium]GIK21318.1 MAG: hypothetical protein BroJett005_07320 [Ignavibacteriota bacterium]